MFPEFPNLPPLRWDENRLSGNGGVSRVDWNGLNCLNSLNDSHGR